MKLFLYVFTVLWTILPNVFSQTTMPAQPATPAVPAEIQRAMNLLFGAGWADAQKLATERDALETALPALIAGDMRLADLIAEKASSSDLLMQSIYKGLLTASDRGVDSKDLLPKFFEKVSKSTDPADLPDRSRFWVIRDAMLLNLAIRIVRNTEQRELTADEMTQIASDPSGWINRVSPLKSSSAASSEQPTLDVKTDAFQTAVIEKVAPTSAPQKAREAKSTPSKPNDEQASSTPRSVIVVLIVAAGGLLWLLFKRRS